MDKMDGMTMDIEQANVEKMREIFPEVFADGKIDFDKLQGLLGHYIADDKEKYSFSWKGKADSLRLAQKRSTGTLRPCKEESKNWDTTENLYIEGDNLEVLKLLQSSYLNSVKMIYIDPPYNTGNDFVYTDDFADGIAHYKEVTGQATKSNPETAGRYHTNWLNMMYPRLKLARNLLTDDGVIFISIDDNEQANLKKICDEIFLEDNYLGTIVWQSATDNNPTQIAVEHEYILAYAKKKDKLPAWTRKSKKVAKIIDKYNELKRRYNNSSEIEKNLRAWIKANSKELKGVTHYCFVDEKGVYYPGNSSNTRDGGYRFDIIHPLTKKVCAKPDFGYRWKEETFLEAAKNGDVEWGDDETTIPKIKKRIETVEEQLKSYYYEDNRAWTAYLTKIFGKKTFDNPKSVTLLKRLVQFASTKGDIVIDFFSGSGSSAQAIFEANIEDDSNRKFILVQLPENLDRNYEQADSKAKPILRNAIEFLSSINRPHYITELAKERIRRAGEKIKEENKDKEGIENLDIGFKVFKLDSSNLVKWDNTPTTDEEEVKNRIRQLSMDYLVGGRKDLDLVYEIMLKYGLSLILPVEEREFDGVSAYIINSPGYKVLICLEPNITMSAVEEMDKEPIGTYIFADRCFTDANILSNTEEILKKKDKEMRLF